MTDVSTNLPPGFRFHPTDEEIITHYLTPKAMDPRFSAAAIGEVNLNKCEPWDLPAKAKMREKEWYFFCQKDRKYPTGSRTNRSTESGYWKATGKDKEIFRGKGVLVGMKKTLVFYMGRAPKGEKTNWVIHEFRIEGSYTNLPRIVQDEWVVSRVFHKKMAEKKEHMDASYFSSGGSSSLEMSNIQEMDVYDNLLGKTLPYTSAETNDGFELAVRMHCKVEEFSNESTMLYATQDMAKMSTDWYDHELDDPGYSADPCIGLDNIFNY